MIRICSAACIVNAAATAGFARIIVAHARRIFVAPIVRMNLDRLGDCHDTRQAADENAADHERLLTLELGTHIAASICPERV